MSNDVKIETAICPKCDLEWPYASEQAVVLDKVGVCYGCFISEVVGIRDHRLKQINYRTGNCPTCLSPVINREDCVTCAGRGWVVLDDEDEMKLVAKK